MKAMAIPVVARCLLQHVFDGDTLCSNHSSQKPRILLWVANKRGHEGILAEIETGTFTPYLIAPAGDFPTNAKLPFHI